jgi:rare lipoprotein A
MAGAAVAQPAPITYAGQGGSNAAQPAQTASLENGLAGGGENAYGYGANSRRRTGAMIDIRRAGNGARSEPIALTPQPVADEEDDAETPEQGVRATPSNATAPQWVEQERVGPPYEANGRWYVPTPEPGYAQTGTASWYGPTFHGQRTASGETFDQEALTAAHPTLPIPSLVQVTNLENGREVIVRVNDRGPFVGERLIDMSHGAAVALGFESQGQARVHVRYLGPAPRRVNADGQGVATPSPLPARAVSTPAPAVRPMVEEGPATLRTPASDDLDGGPVENTQPVYRASAPAAEMFVQVGAFSDLSNAHRVRDEVSRAGPVQVDVRETASGELFRVRIGPLTSQETVEAARRTLADLGYAQTIVASR